MTYKNMPKHIFHICSEYQYFAFKGLYNTNNLHISSIAFSRKLISQVLFLLKKACKSCGALFRRWCYFSQNGKKSMQKSSKFDKFFDMRKLNYYIDIMVHM